MLILCFFVPHIFPSAPIGSSVPGSKIIIYWSQLVVWWNCETKVWPVVLQMRTRVVWSALHCRPAREKQRFGVAVIPAMQTDVYGDHAKAICIEPSPKKKYCIYSDQRLLVMIMSRMTSYWFGVTLICATWIHFKPQIA